jgi:hypothetical protein
VLGLTAQGTVDHEALRGDPHSALAELAGQALVDVCGRGHLATA